MTVRLALLPDLTPLCWEPLVIGTTWISHFFGTRPNTSKNRARSTLPPDAREAGRIISHRGG
jgi:hypothetical protein